MIFPMDEFSPPAQEEELLPPVKVPAEALSPEALNGVIDNFVLREGTDYGFREVSHEAKVERVRAQLKSGEVRIVFDPNTESVTLMTAREWKRSGGVNDDAEDEA